MSFAVDKDCCYILVQISVVPLLLT